MSVRALKHTRNLSFVVAGLLFAGVAIAQTPEERGLEIATMVQAQDDGFTDSESVSYTHLTLPTNREV